MGDSTSNTFPKPICTAAFFHLISRNRGCVFKWRKSNRGKINSINIFDVKWWEFLAPQATCNVFQIQFCTFTFPDVASGLESVAPKKGGRERKKKRQFVPVTGGIQRQQRCYRAPIKKLSVLWRWPASQPLLTTLRFQSVRLTAHSVSACLALDEASSHGAISSPKWKILLWFSS